MGLVSKISLFLCLIVSVLVLFVFLENIKLRNKVNFLDGRIEILERRPVSGTSQIAPAGKADFSEITSYIDSKLESGKIVESSKSATLKNLNNSQTPPPASPTPASKKAVSYVPVFGGSFETTQTSWTAVPGSNFYFQVSDFGVNSFITWSVNIYVVGGSGEAGVRLFDVTNGVAVPGSELVSTSGTLELKDSGRLIFLGGNNTYRVEIKSKTSSPVVFDSGRMKIVY